MEDENAVQIPCPWCDEYYTASIAPVEATVSRRDECSACHRPVLVTATWAEGEIVTLEAERG